MKKSKKTEYESSLRFWFTVIGTPFGITFAICLGFKLKMEIAIPLSGLIAVLIGLIAYVIVLKGEIRDLRRQKRYGKKE